MDERLYVFPQSFIRPVVDSFGRTLAITSTWGLFIVPDLLLGRNRPLMSVGDPQLSNHYNYRSREFISLRL